MSALVVRTSPRARVPRRSRLVIPLALLLCCAAPAPSGAASAGSASGVAGPEWATAGEDGTWMPLPLFGVRFGHTAIMDPIRGRMIVFAGGGSNDVWALSIAGTPQWTRLATAGAIPEPRTHHSAILDPPRERMIVFGGTGASRWNDVWELSLSGTPTWNRIMPSGTPPSGRFGHEAIYDPLRDRMIVFGGYASSALNEVWALSLSGTPAWTRLTPGGTAPGARYGHAAIYDAARDRMLVLGGAGAPPTPYDDVWALSLSGGTSWSPITVSGTRPAGRFHHSAILDRARDRVVVLGGALSLAGPYDSHADDLWTLSLAGSPAWAPATPGGARPAARAEHTAVLDEAAERMLVFAGNGGNTRLYDDTWSLPLGGALEWTRLDPLGTPPGPRVGHSAIHAGARDRMIVFGGSDWNDTWELAFAPVPRWTRLAPLGTAPGVRRDHTAIYDPPRDRMIVFGGAGLNDTWELSLSPVPRWTQLSPSGTPPAGRSDHTAIHDPVRNRMIVFGGAGLDDTWELRLTPAPAWNRLTPLGAPPGGRAGHTAIYDPVRDRMIVFGGAGLNDVWALKLAEPPEWTRVLPSGSAPGPRPNATAIYDPWRDRMLIYGGGSSIPSYSEVWALALSGAHAWTQLAPLHWGTNRSGHSAIYDPLRDQMVVFGGEAWSCAACYTVLDDSRALVWDHPTPVLASLVSAEAEPGRVRLTWHASGSAGESVTVQRRSPGSDWTRVGEAVADAGDRVRHEDVAVTAGARYGYRLGFPHPSGAAYAGETWVDVPRGTLALEGVRPNPSGGNELTVALVLPGGAPAALELVDLGGRLLAARDLAGLAPGRHVVSLARDTRLPPGIYLVRLRQGTDARVARVSVLR